LAVTVARRWVLPSDFIFAISLVCVESPTTGSPDFATIAA